MRFDTEWTVNIFNKQPVTRTYRECCKNKYPLVINGCQLHRLAIMQKQQWQRYSIRLSINSLTLSQRSCKLFPRHNHRNNMSAFRSKNHKQEYTTWLQVLLFPRTEYRPYRRDLPLQELVSLNNHHTPTLKRLCKNQL